jgi:hypothetical protein
MASASAERCGGGGGDRRPPPTPTTPSGVLGVARHAHGRAVELVHERQGLLLELRPRTGWGEIDVVHLWPHYAEFIDEPLGVVGDARR